MNTGRRQNRVINFYPGRPVPAAWCVVYVEIRLCVSAMSIDIEKVMRVGGQICRMTGAKKSVIRYVKNTIYLSYANDNIRPPPRFRQV